MSVVVPTVLGSVNATFSWMLQYMNGGILNALVEPTAPSEGSPSFELKPNPNILLKLLLGKMDEASLVVLGALPADLGGGADGVQNATKHPNREGTLMIASLVFLVLAVVILLILFILSFVCCCCCSSGRRRKSKKSAKDLDSEDTSSVYTVSSSDYTEEKVELSKEYQNIFCCGLHLLVIVFTALCVVGLIVCLGYYFGAASTLSEVLVNKTTSKADAEQWLNGETSAFSLGGLLKFGTMEIFSFAKGSVQSAKASTTSAVTELDHVVFTKTLPRELEVFVEKLIIAFKLKMIQNAVHDFESDMSGLSSASDYIEKNWKNIVPAVEQKGQELNDALNEIKTGCPYLEQEADNLGSNFKKALVKEIPAELNTALATTSAKLKQMSDKLDGVMEQVGSVHTTISEQIKENLDVASMLEELNGMWDTIDSNLTPMEQEMDKMMNTVSGFLGQYSSLVKALLFVLAIPFLLAAIFFTLFLVVFIVEAIYRHLFSLTGTSASEVAAADPWIAKSCVCGGGKFCCCSCVLILPVLLLGIFACLAITLNGFAGVEVCPYITNTAGINMTDYVLNSKVKTIWDDAVNSAGPSERQTGELGSLLNPKPPQNLLYAVEVGCAPSAAAQETPAPGLLAQMGMTNLVDFSAFVNDPALTNRLAEVKTTITEEIFRKDLSSLIPEDVLTDLEKSVKALQAVINGLNLPATISHLQTEKFKIPELKALERKCPNHNQLLHNLLSALSASNGETEKLKAEYEHMESGSQQLSLDGLKEAVGAFKQVTGVKTEVEKAVDEPFDGFTQKILDTVSETGTQTFDTMTKELMPCGSLHYAVKSMIYMGCGPSGMAPRLFAWGLFFALCLLFTVLTLISLFCLWRVQNHQAKRFAGAEYEVVY